MKVQGLKLKECFGEADLSKDMSGPEIPPELRRSWTTVLGMTPPTPDHTLYALHLSHTTILTLTMKLVPDSYPERANGVRSYFQLGDEGLSSGGTKLNSIFITAEVTFTKPK
ncbi:hypothetical protein Tco_0569042 [Tanacetum coccineum]